ISVPGGSPDAVNTPVQAFQDLLTQSVPITGHLRRVIHRAVALHRDRVSTGTLWVADADIDPVIGHPHLWYSFVTPRSDRADDLFLEWALRVVPTVLTLERQSPHPVLCEIQVTAQFLHTRPGPSGVGKVLRLH